MNFRLFFLILATVVSLTNGNGATRHKLDSTNKRRTLPNIGIQYKEDLHPAIQTRQAVACDGLISQALIDEIRSYQPIADQIIDTILNGPFKGRAYNDLADFVDKYPIRLSGFQNLEDSNDYIMDKMKNDYLLEHVRGEQVSVPHWVRGEEKAEMLEPWSKTIQLLGLGTTVGTQENGFSAEAVVVKSFEDLESKKDIVKGKIVVYNQGWLGTYGQTNVYRTQGASRASQYGAVGVLIQSIAPFSLNTPHTGGQTYWANVTHIPAACITMEDADLLYRLQARGEKIVLSLKMLDYNLPMTTSRNVIGELAGLETLEEYVAVTGHIDSWDVGQGAMDDGGGVMISVVALAAIRSLNLRPRRTLQAILWTSEEPGLWGVKGFAEQHKNELENYSAVFESDGGTFKPLGLDFAGTEEAGCIVQEILQLVHAINATTYQRFPSVSSDISVLIDEGVPGLSLNNADDMYFWYHHTEADSITMQDPTEMDLDTALWAVTSYVLADLSVKLPRAVTPPA